MEAKELNLKFLNKDLDYITDRLSDIIAFMSNSEEFESLDDFDKMSFSYQRKYLSECRIIIRDRIKKIKRSL